MRRTILILCILSLISTKGKSELSPTRTLPVIYVNTENQKPVTDTETQIPATVYIDSVIAGLPSLGSSSAPLPASIKGRGNWTWNGFDKKPYKLKFQVKQKVLGMPNNRHWCLLAYADDYLGFLKGPAGFSVSRAVGLRWTPRQVPVELVLNGQYMGLYFLTEHVRIAANRVNIHEQSDNETQPDSVSGGWLIEIDNYRSPDNIEFKEGNGEAIMVSLREPENLSSPQRTYIEQQLYTLNEVLYGSSSSQLESLLDIREAAKFYLVQEIMEDCESYHGSCFLYKDRDSLGVADRWKFGPVWDFGNAYDRRQDTWIYVNPTWPQIWIGQLASWPVFQQAVSEEWYLYYHNHKDSVSAQISDFGATIAAAAKRDAQRWNGTQGYNDNSDMSEKTAKFFRRYNPRIQWLYSQWGEGTPPPPPLYDGTRQSTHTSSPYIEKKIVNGQIRIKRGDKTYDIMGKRVE